MRYTVARVVTSDAFAEAWDSINRGAHTAASNVLTGEAGGALEVKGDTITLNVGAVIEELQKQLIGVPLVGAEDIPGAHKSIVLVHNDHLSEARDAARWLSVVAPWLPWAVVVLAGLGIWAAPSHRVALMAAGIGIGAMMCVLLIAVAVIRQICLDAVPPPAQSQDAAAALYDTLVRFLRQTIFTVLLTALLTVIAGYLYGHGRGAAAVRTAAARSTRTAGHALARTGLKPGAVGQWLRMHRSLTTGVVIAAGALALVLWNYPTPASVVLVLLVVVVVLATLGVLAAADAAEQRLSGGGGCHPPLPGGLLPAEAGPGLRITGLIDDQGRGGATQRQRLSAVPHTHRRFRRIAGGPNRPIGGIAAPDEARATSLSVQRVARAWP